MLFLLGSASDLPWWARVLTTIGSLLFFYGLFIAYVVWTKIVRRCNYIDADITSLGPSNPTAGLRLDKNKLAELDTFLAGDPLRERGLQKTIATSDGQPAVVTSVEPLRVAAYSDDFDAIVTLKFPSTVDTTDLQVGTRLLSANTYSAFGARERNAVASDIKPGPNDAQMFDNFIPIIVQFVSSDEPRINKLMAGIPSEDWKRLAELARGVTNRRWGHRDGRPSLAHRPGGFRWFWYLKLQLSMMFAPVIAIFNRG
jgi:hypothetical protein